MSRKRRWDYDDFFYAPSTPISTDAGIKAHSQRGSFTQNWWATRWIDALESLGDSGRLSRGRSYARRGQVLSIEEKKDGIDARVQGSRPRPYKITIRLAPLSADEWEKVIDALADQAIFTAQLLAGEMPLEIDQAFKAARVSLFPERQGDLITDCSCPDWGNPCKHVAATHYILGERFDEDPFLLFRLRGRTQEQILQGLRQRRAGALFAEEEEPEEPEVVVPLEETLDHFWQAGAPLEGFAVSIRAPEIAMPLLKRLGEPAFAPELQRRLGPALEEISQAAIRAAFSEEEP